jgi:hypothetical protein
MNTAAPSNEAGVGNLKFLSRQQPFPTSLFVIRRSRLALSNVATDTASLSNIERPTFLNKRQQFVTFLDWFPLFPVQWKTIENR